MACTIYQDLTDYESVRGRLVSTKPTSFVGKQLAHYLAFTLFYTSDFYLSWAEKKAKQVKFINLESCLMTENDLFTAPYQNLDTKSHHQVNQKLALALKEDDDLKAEVAELKGKFLNTSQALLHGDLQTDSIVANDKEIKVIGTQHSFYGPIGFDLGCILGHFLLNFCTSAIFLTSHKKADHLDTLIQIIRESWNHFADLFSQLMANNTHDIALQNDTYHARYLRGIFLDSLGFAGCELIRRALETSPVAEIESITDETKQSLAKQHIIQLGRVLIKKRYQFVSIDDVLLEAEAIIEQE
jgi:5-methylthioribose kinase